MIHNRGLKKLGLAFLSALSVTLLPPAVSAAHAGSYLTDRGCNSSESWNWDGEIAEEYRNDYMTFVSHGMVPVQAFAEGIAIRRFALKQEFKTFGEYWISRSLLEAKLPHIAIGGFASIASRPVTDEIVGIQIAALDCLVRIQAEHSGLGIPAPVVALLSQFARYAKTPAQKEVVYDAAGVTFRQMLADQNDKFDAVEPLFDILKGSGAHETFAKALWASKHNDNREATKQWEALFQYPSLPKSIARFNDYSHILAARAHYTLGHFDTAQAHLKQVRKASNELADSLSELAWAYLQDERYPQAIGTSLNLDAGGLRHTFTPEGPMVMAMAMNEICQFPESVKAITRFRKDYEQAYKWLDAHSDDIKDYYPLAVQFVRKQGNTPDRVASEWVRSPLFISAQDEINVIFDEKEASNVLATAGARESHRLIVDILKHIDELKPKWVKAKMKRKAGQDMPPSLVAEVTKIRRMVLHYHRLNAAAPVWKSVMGSYHHTAPGIEAKLIKKINEDIAMRSRRMLTQLEEIAENIELIEVEIYNGASQDIIWQNAHPDYKALAQKMKDDNTRETRALTWDWGRTPTSDVDNQEVWEDELGSAAVNLMDNCSSKDKYLALKTKGHS